jgi:pyridoxamine 5'-phosphate oxidase
LINFPFKGPRASQIGALASPQSQPIPSRQHLDDIEAEIKQKLGPDGVVPLPNWGGYCVTPTMIEFWQGQTNRLHDRIRFRKVENVEKVNNIFRFENHCFLIFVVDCFSGS